MGGGIGEFRSAMAVDTPPRRNKFWIGRTTPRNELRGLTWHTSVHKDLQPALFRGPELIGDSITRLWPHGKSDVWTRLRLGNPFIKRRLVRDQRRLVHLDSQAPEE